LVRPRIRLHAPKPTWLIWQASNSISYSANAAKRGRLDLNKLTLTAALCAGLLMAATARAQQADAAFGMSTVMAPSASYATGQNYPQSLTGGLYPSFSWDYLFLKHDLGVGANFSWRASRGDYAGVLPFRPIFYDVNAVYAPRLGKSLAGELSAGIGGVNLRFYNPAGGCGFGCINYVTSNHFLGHFGVGLRAYVYKNLFVRPEANFYLINNNVEFSSGRVVRLGMSMGYSFGR
jgi:hypothetical protein